MKVRLKLEAAKVATAGEKFQFHEGPIKTISMRILNGLELSFNSMKVRLKHFVQLESWFLDQFQFHEGPIKTFVN